MKNIVRTILSAVVAVTFIAGVQAQNEKSPKRPKHMSMKRMLEKMDADKDGKISKSEWTAHHEQRFTDIDANKDGQLEPEEFKNHRKAMRDKRKGEMKKGPKGKGPKKAVAPTEE